LARMENPNISALLVLVSLILVNFLGTEKSTAIGPIINIA